MILDEAQHIKNRSTQNAQAARQIKAVHRLVLTGTPMENAVGDLWSIMDFLMPGYLGPHEAFRQNYELPIDRSGAMGELAQTKLRRKLHPFLLRRLKTQVASDLPPKIERISSCTLTADQKIRLVPATVAVGDNLVIDATFTPAALGTVNGSIVVSSDDPTGEPAG